MEESEIVLAKKMYDAYCKSVGGKAFNGDDLPGSDDFFKDISKKKQSQAWIDAAKEAINFLS